METPSPNPELARILELSSAPRRSRGRWIAAAAMVLLLVTAAFVAWRVSRREVRYETITAKRADLVATVSATGTIEPTDQVEIGSEVSGIIEAVLVDFNDRVEANQVIAKLNTESLVAGVRSSRASLNAAAATLKEAEVNAEERKADLARQSMLFEQEMVSQQVIDTARFASLRAEAAAESARAQIGRAHV